MKYFLLPALLAFSLVLGAQSASFFINEISYTASNPSAKGFEIAGLAGSQLNGWSVVEYDADGWQKAIDNLPNQIIPNQQNGYGTIWYDIDQAGDEGGLALMDASGTVQQFLAYGALTGADLLEGALDGPAANVIPEYIGLVSNPGAALQLIGAGNLYPTFFWASTQVPSLGQVNDNQLFIPNSVGLVSNPDNQGGTVENSLEVKTWPNPTTDLLHIRLPESDITTPRVLSLYDQNGRQLIRQELSSERQTTQVDVSRLPAGMYYLTVFSRDNPWQSEVFIR